MNLQKWLENHSVKLLAIRDTPNAIAGGVAIGVFFGFTPLFGFKTLLSIFVAWIFRCNLLAAAIGVTLHDLAFFFLPVILRLEYDVGYWATTSPHHLPPPFRHQLNLHHIHAEDWFNWDRLVNTVIPLMAGSIIFGLPIAGLSFFVTQGAVLRHHHKRALAEARGGKVRKIDELNPS